VGVADPIATRVDHMPFDCHLDSPRRFDGDFNLINVRLTTVVNTRPIMTKQLQTKVNKKTFQTSDGITLSNHIGA
jgi:hypothetical protein